MLAILTAALLVTSASDFTSPLTPAEIKLAQETIAAFRIDRLGPYNGVMWFCKDGTQQQPRPYGCVEHEGGLMYGTFSPKAERLAKLGLFGGTILAPLTAEDILADSFYRARALVIERYLERSQNGWVLERAKTFRGFRQDEDESEASRRLLMDLAAQADMLERGRAVLIRLSRALPYGRGGEALAEEIRAMAAELGDADRAFASLRFKIHSLPEPNDAVAVDAYASHPKRNPEYAQKARALAEKIRQYYDPALRFERLRSIKRWLAIKPVRQAITAFLEADANNPLALIDKGAALVEVAGAGLKPATDSRNAERNLLRLHTVGIVEELWLGIAVELQRISLSRRQAIEVFTKLLRVAELAGLLSARERESVSTSVQALSAADAITYATEMRRVSKVFEWSRARLLAELGIPLARYGAVEPKSAFVIDDILRSGIMLPLATLYDRMIADAERVGGGGHRLVGMGALAPNVRGENAGIAVGPLVVVPQGGLVDGLGRDAVVLLNDLPPDLPPVAGIITVGASGSLSHLAMLARNLGIPLCAVTGEVASTLSGYAGQRIVLGVSSKRRVLLGPVVALPPSDLSRLPMTAPAAASITAPMHTADVGRLDLNTARILALDEVDALDAGVRVGPKAAELGRLRRLFPTRVSDAVVIPFGVFVRHVDSGTAPTPLSELKAAYSRYSAARGTNAKDAESALLVALSHFREQILQRPFPAGFEQEVRQALLRFGAPGTFGVFVRSDTNVEDLKDFTGAGLNLTVPNRVATNEIFQAIREVWTSPFGERSFRWRQSVISNPEHVYPSVLLHRTVASDISGVVVTTDVETYSPTALTISAGEGVSAVVDGGAPETLVVMSDGGMRLLSSFRSPTRKVIPKPPRAGVQLLPALGRDPLLSPRDLSELIALVVEVKTKMPVPAEGTPWDIEFGLALGKAMLMQIRPLKISRAASAQPLLQALDSVARTANTAVVLDEVIP